MRVGILGSGLMGAKLGTLFARAGHMVVFSYARSAKKLQRLAREAGKNARAGTPREAAQDTDVLLFAVHWSRVDDVLKQAGDVSGKTIITCSLPMNTDSTELVIANTSSGAEALAKKTPHARVVCAFNNRAERSLVRRLRCPPQGQAAEPRLLQRRYEGQTDYGQADERHRI